MCIDGALALRWAQDGEEGVAVREEAAVLVGLDRGDGERADRGGGAADEADEVREGEFVSALGRRPTGSLSEGGFLFRGSWGNIGDVGGVEGAF